jgi:hypothetical protein
VRPMLTPGLRWAWRAADTVQFGIDVPRPVVVGGLPPVSRELLPMLDGIRHERELLGQLGVQGCSESEVTQAATVIARLSDLSLVVDGGRWPGGGPLPAATRDRLMPDHRCASALERFRADPATRWAALGGARVSVVGVSRLGATIGRVLAAAGIARVELDDPRPVTPADVCSGGFSPSDVGMRRSNLLAEHPEWGGGSPSRRIDRQVVVVTDAVDSHSRCRRLAATDTAHVLVSCRELIGRVGPFVVPGRSPCHFCLELARRDIDPGWADVWRQQVAVPTPDADGVLVGITANVAAAHVIEWLAGGQPPSVGGFVDVVAPHGTTHRRALAQHAECGCAWPDSEAYPTMSR